MRKEKGTLRGRGVPQQMQYCHSRGQLLDTWAYSFFDQFSTLSAVRLFDFFDL